MHLLLDVDGVLQFHRGDFSQQVEQLGWQGDYAAFLQTLFTDENYLRTLEGRGDVRVVLDELLQAHDQQVDANTLLSTWANSAVEFNHPLLQALPHLSTSSLHLATNQESVRALRIRDAFATRPGIQGLFISCELGARKPHAAYFEQVLASLACHATQAVFVDDHLENVEGARSVGMHAIHYQSNEDLFQRLTALGITTKR